MENSNNFLCRLLAVITVFLVVTMSTFVVAYADEADEGAEETASLSWVESDGEHVKEKNLFETERIDFTLPVLDSDGSAVNDVKFQIWNATTQTNETEVFSADGKISVSLLKNHNYIFFPIDKSWEGKTYVWVRDGKLVSTKSLTKDSLESPTVWSYPEVTQVTLSKRTTELDNADDARRHTFRWYLKRQGSDIALANQTVEFVSTLETVQGSVFTGSGMTTISASLLEDVDYMVIYKSPSGVTLGVEPFPIVYKDKSEYPSQYSEYWPVASTYDHRCCQQVTYFNVIGQSEIGSTWDSIKTDDGNTVVEGMDFTDEQSGRYPTLHTQTLNQKIDALSGSDYAIYSIKTMNTARSETFKVAGMDFKIAQKIDSGKTVKAIYELNADGALSQLDTFTQVGDTVKFTTNTLSDKPVVIEYTNDAPAVNRVLNVKVVDEEGNAVRGTQLVLRCGGDKEEYNISLPANDAYGETSWTCTNDVFEGAYKLDSYSYSSSQVLKTIDVIFGKDSTGNAYVSAINDEPYSGLVTVVVKSPVNRSILKVKAVDGAGQPVEGISLKLIPDADNETHYDDNVYFSNLTNRDGVTSLDISDLIVGDGSTEYWTLDVTSGQDGEASNIYKLKAPSMISISDDDSVDSPGISEWDIIPADPATGIEYSSKTYEGVVQLNVIKNSVVQYETGATHAQAPSYQIVENGTKLQEPQLETDGTPLLGWYTDSDYNNAWDFDNDIVKTNITLCAKWGEKFSDVDEATYHVDDINWTRGKGITTGFPDGTFRPYDNIARCDMAAFLYRMMGSPADEISNDVKGVFSDVDESTPHAEAIWWMATKGITTGFSDGTFRPYDYVARCDMAAFLYRTVGSPVVDGLVTDLGLTDVGENTPHYKEILWMASKEITKGFPDGTFRPYNNIARCDMAAFLHRTYNVL